MTTLKSRQLENQLFVKRSQYIRVKNPLHKQSEKTYMCFKTRRASTHDYTNDMNNWQSVCLIHSILGKSDSSDTVLKTTHQNQIPGIQIQEGDKSSAQVVSTVASDGLLVSWNLGNLETLMNGLTLWKPKVWVVTNFLRHNFVSRTCFKVIDERTCNSDLLFLNTCFHFDHNWLF